MFKCIYAWTRLAVFYLQCLLLKAVSLHVWPSWPRYSDQSGEILKTAKEHTKQINDIQTSVDLTMFISASKDNTAKVRDHQTTTFTTLQTGSLTSSSCPFQLIDSTSLEHIKTFRTERPVNSAAISPIMDHVGTHSHTLWGCSCESLTVNTSLRWWWEADRKPWRSLQHQPGLESLRPGEFELRGGRTSHRVGLSFSFWVTWILCCF